ncbi:MAG: dihydrofolate reductase [Gammaproteobacteria bacterium]|nr:dihydrofolate reductase [Gammaproteobacteria bacterium]
MMITLVAAMTPERVIGKNNSLPWQMPADLAHFKKITLGKPIIMGRKTYQSIGRLLPGRKNIIITRDKNFYVEGAEIFHDIDSALNSLKNEKEICVIGGSEIFAQTLSIADILELTYIQANIDGDSFFPEVDPNLFKEISREAHKADEDNIYDYVFVKLSRMR